MKTLFLILMVACSSSAFADVYVITNSDGSIYSMSEKNDTVAPEGTQTSVVQGKSLKDMNLTQEPDLYEFKAGKLKLSPKKVLDRAETEKKLLIADDAEKTAKKVAKDKLRALGLTDIEMDALLGKK